MAFIFAMEVSWLNGRDARAARPAWESQPPDICYSAGEWLWHRWPTRPRHARAWGGYGDCAALALALEAQARGGFADIQETCHA